MSWSASTALTAALFFFFSGSALADVSANPAVPGGVTTAPEPAPVATPSAREPAPPPAPRDSNSGSTPHRTQDLGDAPGPTSVRPIAGDVAPSPDDVFSESWWGHARPIIELHGYFRTRAELFQNFMLGRHNSTVQSATLANDPQYLFPSPLDNSYTLPNGNPGQTVNICGNASSPNQPCYDKTESGANLRLRLNPEIHISDNLRIITQITLLDNLVLGSTSDAYAMAPSSGTSATASSNGYRSAGANPYAPISLFTTTQGVQTAGVNSWTNSINVTRAWGEYETPVGQLRFGRMPGHWGLGMVENSGDGIDSDYQTTLDRIMFVSGLKPLDLYFGGAWDFVATGPTTQSTLDAYGGQPYNTCNLCNVGEWAAFVAHRTSPEIQRAMLARGDVVLNGGLYTVYRNQYLDTTPGANPNTINYSTGTGYAGTGNQTSAGGLEPRQAWELIPDAWVQLLWQKLRIEAELATIQGQIGWMSGSAITAQNINNPVGIEEWGLATQTQYKAVEDKLNLQFDFGWASGDRWATTLTAPTSGLRTEANGTGPISTFQFHPDYRIDLIFYRHILTRVQGSYYFRPSVDYDFFRHPNGEKVGGGLAVIWSRASEFIQSPGHNRDLGVELDGQLYFQSRDGSLNDDPSKIGGLYAMLQYGVFFPMGGLDYLPLQVTNNIDVGLSPAQTVRLFLGIVF